MQNVVVTGASTGIGRRITEFLSSNGFHVFAGARKIEDIENLNSLSNVTGVRLDVTKLDEIQSTSEIVINHGGAFAIVNNAGISSSGNLLEMSEERYQDLLNVNLLAANRVIQAFFPQLQENNGRIINVGSINGFLVSPFGGAYSISKFGLIAYSEQLSIELQKFGIEVSCIEPGFFHSAIFEKADEEKKKLEKSSKFYKEEYRSAWSTKLRDANIKDPIQVAQRVLAALTDEHPHLHYTVGTRTEESWVFQALLKRIIDVNHGLNTPWGYKELSDLFSQVVETGKVTW